MAVSRRLQEVRVVIARRLGLNDEAIADRRCKARGHLHRARMEVAMVVRMLGSSRCRVAVRPDRRFKRVKVFSATMYQQRDQLGEAVTAWIASHPDLAIVDITVVQSSDAAFHCVTIVVAYWEPHARR